MLEEIEMLCNSNKIRKHSIMSHEEEMANGSAEDEFDEEKTCNICCYNGKDTTFVPCGH